MGVKALGVNHVAFEVDDLDVALAWWARFFEFELRGRVPGMAFIDLGDQFVALFEHEVEPRSEHRHFGLVVDDVAAVVAAARERGVDVRVNGSSSPGNDEAVAATPNTSRATRSASRSTARGWQTPRRPE